MGVLLRDQYLDSARIVAAFAQHLGQLTVWLRSKSAALQRDPAQATLHVERRACAEAVVSKAIDKQVARCRPALFLVEQDPDMGSAEIEGRTVLKLDVAPIQEDSGGHT